MLQMKTPRRRTEMVEEMPAGFWGLTCFEVSSMSASEGGRKSAVVLLCSVHDQLDSFIFGGLIGDER